METPRPAAATEYSPDFVLAHRDAIHESDWADWEAQGYSPIITIEASDMSPDILNITQDVYGVEHVYTGDAYDSVAGRPLRHKPGYSIYTHPDGRAKAKEWSREQKARRQPGAPAAS